MQAEKNSSDKFICYDCNNWLINWSSLQNVNETTEQSSSDGTRDSDRNTNFNKKQTDNINSIKINNHEYVPEFEKESKIKTKTKKNLLSQQSPPHSPSSSSSSSDDKESHAIKRKGLSCLFSI